MDQRARETAGVLKVKQVEAEVVGGGYEEESAPPLVAHPCSLLQLLLRACAGCLGLHDNDDPKPAAADDGDLKPVADDGDDGDLKPAVEETPQEGAGGGGEAASYLQEVVGTRGVRKPTPPGPPRPGGGGEHH